MKRILEDKLKNLSNAIKKLEKAVKEEGYELTLDGTIKRFEFTFEMSWKALKKFLLYEGFDCNTVRECIKKTFQAGFIDNEEVWLNMLEDRNKSSYIYDEEEANKIYKRIKEFYLNEFKKLEEKLKSKRVYDKNGA